MDRLESMSILVAAAEEGSLSAAARRLGIPLTNVSRKVSELEAYLKTGLVNRSSRRLTLTDAGRSYVADCKRILDLVGEAERAATGEYGAPRRSRHHRPDRVRTPPCAAGYNGISEGLSRN